MLRLVRSVVTALVFLAPALGAEEKLLDLSQLPPLDFDDEDGEEETAAEETLPRPSLAEPFAIGEALYDPARVPVAVVSLLELLGVPIVADQAAADAAKRPTLSEAEVRLLIEMGVEDASAASESDDSALPHSLADLHALVAPYMPELTLELLAGAYAEAYGDQPDGLVPSVLMGQPLDLDTQLSRVHLWMLLVDGFVGTRGPAALGGGATNAVLRSSGRAPRDFVALGAAPQRAAANVPVDMAEVRRIVSEWRRQDPDWWWTCEHEMLIASRIPLVVAPRAPRAHEGHGGPGATVSLSARIAPNAPPIRSPSGRAVLVPLPQARQRPAPMTWRIGASSLSTLQAHGTLQGTYNAPVRVAPGGSLALSYVPKREKANGRGARATETATIQATVEIDELVGTAYEIPQNVRSHRYESTKRTPVSMTIEWHALGLELFLENSYSAGWNFGPLGWTKRSGVEGARGTLELQPDGSYRGIVRARWGSVHEAESPLQNCALAISSGGQKLLATARPVSGLNRNQDPARMRARQGAMDGGYLKLEFEPLRDPVFRRRDPCQDADELLRTDSFHGVRWAPFNDARWWTPEHSFVVAIPREGKLVYTDGSLADSQPPAQLGPLAKIITGTFSELQVEVDRQEEP